MGPEFSFSCTFLYVVHAIAESIANIQTFHWLHVLTEARTYAISIGLLPPLLYVSITTPNSHSIFHWTAQVARHVLFPGGMLYFQVLHFKVPVSWVQPHPDVGLTLGRAFWGILTQQLSPYTPCANSLLRINHNLIWTFYFCLLLFLLCSQTREPSGYLINWLNE